MLAEITLFPDQASTAATRVDALLFFLLGTSTFFVLLIFGVIIYFCIKYRRRSPDERPPRIRGSLRLELFWTAIPLVIAMGAFAWGVQVYFYIIQPPEDAMEIYVVAKQWMWKVQHPEGQREINALHIPLGQPVKLTLTSEDVIHDFFVPAFRVKVDVLPARYVHTWFQATKVGQYDFFCSQYCGTNHSGMIGRVVVMEPAAYREWLREGAEGSLALDGRKLFLKHQCVVCHSADASARGPVLEGLYLRPVQMQDNRTLLADDNYLRESIVAPEAKIVAGYEPIMPSYAQQLNEEELIQLVEFIKSLRPGHTPPRIETAPAPVAKPPAAEAPTEVPPSKPPGLKP
jgi:cytochrome c oxidase subunit 2